MIELKSGQLRLSPSAQEVLRQVEQAPTIVEGVRLMATLFDIGVKQIYRDVRFDGSSGKPLEGDWQPYEPWDGSFGGDDSYLYPNENSPFMLALLGQLNPDQALIVDDIVVYYMPSRQDHGYIISSYFRLIKAKVL